MYRSGNVGKINNIVVMAAFCAATLTRFQWICVGWKISEKTSNWPSFNLTNKKLHFVFSFLCFSHNHLYLDGVLWFDWIAVPFTINSFWAFALRSGQWPVTAHQNICFELDFGWLLRVKWVQRSAVSSNYRITCLEEHGSFQFILVRTCLTFCIIRGQLPADLLLSDSMINRWTKKTLFPNYISGYLNN